MVEPVLPLLRIVIASILVDVLIVLKCEVLYALFSLLSISEKQEKALSTFVSKAFETYHDLVFLLGVSYCSCFLSSNCSLGTLTCKVFL